LTTSLASPISGSARADEDGDVLGDAFEQVAEYGEHAAIVQ
jgi:hypothetical protein